MINESEIIIVHTDESRALQWNPATHEELHEELPDGNMRTMIVPKNINQPDI